MTVLDFSNHAVEQCRQRGIGLEEAEDAWDRPVEQTRPGKRPDTLSFIGQTTSGRRITFVVDHLNRRRIVSVWTT